LKSSIFLPFAFNPKQISLTMEENARSGRKCHFGTVKKTCP